MVVYQFSPSWLSWVSHQLPFLHPLNHSLSLPSLTITDQQTCRRVALLRPNKRSAHLWLLVNLVVLIRPFLLLLLLLSCLLLHVILIFGLGTSILSSAFLFRWRRQFSRFRNIIRVNYESQVSALAGGTISMR